MKIILMANPEAASSFFRLAVDAGLSESFRSLAPAILQTQGISFDDKVNITDRRGDTSHANLSLQEAFWTAALDGNFEGNRFKRCFFTPEGAAFLLEVCPNFFASAGAEKGIFKTIVQLSQADEHFPVEFRSRRLRGERTNNDGDAWLARVIQQQPSPSFFSHDAENAWAALLKMGSEQGILAFLEKRPNAWAIEASKGKPVLKALAPNLKQQVWNAFLESGQDPFQIMGNKPLWRAILPAAPTGLANRESFRESIEIWLKEEHRQGRLDDEGERYLCTIAFNEIFPRTSNGRQMTLTAAMQALEKTPASWVWTIPENKKLPAFMVFLGSTAKSKDGSPVAAGKKWVTAFDENPDWANALGESGRDIVRVANAILSKKSSQLPDRVTMETVEDPHVTDLVLKLCDLTKQPSEPWLSWMRSQKLDLSLRSSSSKNDRRPRL